MKYLYLKTTQDYKKGDIVEFNSGSIIAEQLKKLGIITKYQDKPKENKVKDSSKKVNKPKENKVKDSSKKVNKPKENKVAGPEEQK